MLHLTASRLALPEEPSGALYILDNPEDCTPREINWRETLEPEPLYSRDQADRPTSGDANFFKDPQQPVFGDIEGGEPGEGGEPWTPATYEELKTTTDPYYNLYAGVAVCAKGKQNPTSLLHYRVEDETGYYHNGPTGGVSANEKYIDIEIIAAVKLVKKGGSEDPEEPYREITVECEGQEDQSNIVLSDYVTYFVFPHKIILSSDEKMAARAAIYEAGEAFVKTLGTTVTMVGFSDGVYRMKPSIKHCPLVHTIEGGYCQPHDWTLTNSQTNLWAGTATLTEI